MAEALTVKAGTIKAPWEVRELPEPPAISLRGLFAFAGPAVILGALSVGGFEAYNAGFAAAQKFHQIFWVYIVSSFFQILLNREIARYTMATGETILQGLSRLAPAKFWAPFFAILCLVQQGWPAWIGGAAAGVAFLIGGFRPEVYAMIALGLVFIVFAASKYVYNTLELIMYAAFVVANFGLAFMTVAMTRWEAVGTVTLGWLSFGVIPAGITFSLVGPFLNQPAGGFWNFWHTYWVREKGMGMGAYFGHLTGLVAKEEEIRRTGFIFDTNNPTELEKFSRWMRLNTLTLVTFFVIIGGIFFTYFVSLAGYSAAVYYNMQVPSGWRIAVVMAEIFQSAYGQFGFAFFSIILIFALFDSQFSVYDGIARMMADAIHLESPATLGKYSYRFWYFLVLAFVVLVGMVAVWLSTPYFIWLVLNWFGNFVHGLITIVVVWLNYSLLPKPIKPGRWSIIGNLFWAACVIGFFIAWTVFEGGPQYR